MFLKQLIIGVGLGLWVPLLTLGQPRTAERLKQDLRFAQTDSARAQLYLNLGEAFLEHQLDSSLHYLQRSVDRAKKLPDKRLLSRAYLKLGYAHYKRSNFSRSLAILQQAEQVCRPYPPDSTRLEIQLFIAISYRSQGHYAKALNLFLTALRDYEKLPGQPCRQMGILYTELGIIYDYLHRYDLALAYHQKRLAFSKQRTNPRDLVLAYLNMGAFYENVTRLDQAHDYYQKALALSKQYNLTSNTATVLQSLGDVAYQRRQYKQAVAYLRQSVALQRRVGAEEYIGLGLLSLAKTYRALQNQTAARGYVHQAHSVFQRIGANLYLQKALELESELLTGEGRYRLALQTHLQAQRLKDSLTSVDKQQAIARVQAAYDLERKQQQITALHKDLTIQKQARQTTQLELSLALQQRLLYGISTLLLAGLVGIVYYYYRKQKTVQRSLLRQKAEITQQARQLTELNATKDKLFSLISHDLRSPVARLKQDFYQLRATGQLSPSFGKPFGQLERQVDDILHLLTNLLAWSHTQLTGFQARLQPLNLAGLVADSVGQLTDYIRQKDIRLLNQVSAQDWIVADNVQLQFIVRNLLSNAIKFTPSGGCIRLRTVAQMDRVALLIQDTGIGMSPEEVARLLTDPVVRPGTQGELSTGLGLRLCQELVARQSGTLQVASQPGRGTTVTLTLTAYYSGPQPPERAPATVRSEPAEAAPKPQPAEYGPESLL